MAEKATKQRDVVSDDRNWVGRIQNELQCTKAWQKDWGFLAAGSDNLSLEDATKEYSIDDKIRQVEQKYGRGENLEIFSTKDFNRQQIVELKPIDRKLPKNWKKEKWTCPDDPNDPLKNLFKKKK